MPFWVFFCLVAFMCNFVALTGNLVAFMFGQVALTLVFVAIIMGLVSLRQN